MTVNLSAYIIVESCVSVEAIFSMIGIPFDVDTFDWFRLDNSILIMLLGSQQDDLTVFEVNFEALGL